MVAEPIRVETTCQKFERGACGTTVTPWWTGPQYSAPSPCALPGPRQARSRATLQQPCVLRRQSRVRLGTLAAHGAVSRCPTQARPPSRPLRAACRLRASAVATRAVRAPSTRVSPVASGVRCLPTGVHAPGTQVLQGPAPAGPRAADAGRRGLRSLFHFAAAAATSTATARFGTVRRGDFGRTSKARPNPPQGALSTMAPAWVWPLRRGPARVHTTRACSRRPGAVWPGRGWQQCRAVHLDGHQPVHWREHEQLGRCDLCFVRACEARPLRVWPQRHCELLSKRKHVAHVHRPGACQRPAPLLHTVCH